MHTLSWMEVENAVERVCHIIRKDLAEHVVTKDAQRPVYVYGPPRGGYIPALMVANKLGIEVINTEEQLDNAVYQGSPVVVVDDLVDSGATMRRYLDMWVNLGSDRFFGVYALYCKSSAPEHLHARCGVFFDTVVWLVFPWELGAGGTAPDSSQHVTENVTRLLQFLGEDVTREGLVKTPQRVVKALQEMTSGSKVDDPGAIVREALFQAPGDDMVVVEGIRFSSLCEHHLLPFTGRCTIGYLPTDHVCGLSKTARLVRVFAQRLQLQERLCRQVAECLMTELKCRGVGVIMEAHHACMGCRGAEQPDVLMTTACMLGDYRTHVHLKEELLAHHQRG